MWQNKTKGSQEKKKDSNPRGREKLSDGQSITRKVREEKRKLKRTIEKLKSWSQGNF